MDKILLEIEGIQIELCKENERAVVDLLYERFKPDTIIRCLDEDETELEVLRLDELFNKPEK